MCVPESYSGSHNSQPSRFKDIDSACLCCHIAISHSIQNPELVKNQSFRLSGPPGRHKSDNLNYLGIERYC
jgi:hypothetical protein